MKHYDVIIIGGGPAGAAAGYDLCLAGKSVLLVEKDEFPRFKPCAAMLTIKSLHRLPYSLDPVVKWSTDRIRLSREYKAEDTLSASDTLIVTAVRSELDEYCLNQALAKGVELQVSDKGFLSYKDEGNNILVETGEGSFSCEFLIGADGAHSRVRKQSEQFVPDRTAVALEGRIPRKRLADPEADIELTFDFNVVKKGYGWLIPKDDHINVGIYTRRPDEYPLSKKILKEYAEKRLGVTDIDELLGFPVGTGGEYFSPPPGNILLVGDAGGYAEPIFGEGIHNAIKTGQAAATAILTSSSMEQSAGDLYRDFVEAVRTDVWWCRNIAKAFYKFLPLAFGVLKNTPVRAGTMEGFAGGLTIKECLKSMSPMHKAPEYPVSETVKMLKKQQA